MDVKLVHAGRQGLHPIVRLKLTDRYARMESCGFQDIPLQTFTSRHHAQNIDVCLV
jgi:hypothetical protein